MESYLNLTQLGFLVTSDPVPCKYDSACSIYGNGSCCMYMKFTGNP